MYAEEEAHLLVSAAATPEQLESLVARRVAGVPLEHLLGWAEFCGLRVAIEPGVFVPRRRTEFLVHQAARPGARNPVVVDLCCGSGAVGVAVASALGRAELYAADIDPVAVRCASRNVAAVGGRAVQGDLYAALPRELAGRVDVLVANVPYVPTAEVALLPAEARLHEPRRALDGGPDGLDVLRRVAADAASWLAPRGRLLVETSERQAPVAVEIMRRTGLAAQVARSAQYAATVVTGMRAPGSP